MSRAQRSSVIIQVTKIMQQLELDYDKQRLAKIEGIVKSRRRPVKTGKEGNKDDFNKKMEIIKDLDQHRLPFDKF